VHLGNLLKILGDPVEARATLRQALLLAPNNVEALFELSEITRFTPGDASVATMEALDATGHAPAKLHFALGKAYDDMNRSTEAFRQFERANAEEKARRHYDEPATLATLKRLSGIFSGDFVASAGDGFATELPVFIVGMPRSGSTLLEQILSSHPDVAAAGEQLYLREAMDSVLAGMAAQVAFPDGLAHLKPEDFRTIGARYAEAIGSLSNGRRRVTDKLLSNGLLAGLIRMALPGARIIHCVRDPLDTCLSCYMKSFGPRVPYSTDLAHLGRYYRAQELLMDHWRAILPPERFIQVRYEDLVADIEKESRRLVSFAGLDWDDACLDFHRNERAVNTASVAQVREKLTDSSVGRWRRYAIQLQPLILALKEAAA
jgi:tetratricopeptide (TPR) repeat protein